MAVYCTIETTSEELAMNSYLRISARNVFDDEPPELPMPGAPAELTFPNNRKEVVRVIAADADEFVFRTAAGESFRATPATDV